MKSDGEGEIFIVLASDVLLKVMILFDALITQKSR